MSMYNMLFGMNPASGLLIQALGLDGEAPQNWNERFEKLTDDWGEIDLYSEEAKKLMAEAKEMGYYPTGRFRDIYFENEGTPKIILYTRNGGGNRDFYEYVFELLSSHPLYICDYDDDFDCTYASIEFKAPQAVIDFFDGVQTGKIASVSEKFQKELTDLENGKPLNPAVESFMKSVVEAIENQK